MADIRRGSLGEQVAHDLRVRIIRGELAAGTHLVEDALATEFDVSRGPIRDALKMLEGEGLVEPQRRGVLVRPFTASDVAELYAVRQAIELVSVRDAAAISGHDWTAARLRVGQMRDAADADDQHAFAASDLEFHTEVYRACGNARLLGIWQQLRPVFAVMIDVTNEQDRDLRPAAEDHALLLTAIQDGHGERAAEVLARHLDGSRRRMEAALAGQRAARSGAGDRVEVAG